MVKRLVVVQPAAARLRLRVSSGVAALPSTNAAKHTKVPSSLSASRPVLPEEDWRSALVPVALMGTMFTGAVWLAVEGLTSMMLKVVLLAEVSICKTARLPGVNGTGGAPMVKVAEFVLKGGTVANHCEREVSTGNGR